MENIKKSNQQLFEDMIKRKLLIRGFSKEQIINNRGLISAIIEDVILEMNFKIHKEIDSKINSLINLKP